MTPKKKTVAQPKEEEKRSFQEVQQLFGHESSQKGNQLIALGPGITASPIKYSSPTLTQRSRASSIGQLSFIKPQQTPNKEQEQENSPKSSQTIDPIQAPTAIDEFYKRLKSTSHFRPNIKTELMKRGMNQEEANKFMQTNIPTYAKWKKDKKNEFKQDSDFLDYLMQQLEQHEAQRYISDIVLGIQQEIIKIQNSKKIKPLSEDPKSKKKLEKIYEKFGQLKQLEKGAPELEGIKEEMGLPNNQGDLKDILDETLDNEKYGDKYNETIAVFNKPEISTQIINIVHKTGVKDYYFKLDYVQQGLFLLEMGKKIDKGYIKEGMSDKEIIGKVNADIATLERIDKIGEQIGEIRGKLDIVGPAVLKTVAVKKVEKNTFGQLNKKQAKELKKHGKIIAATRVDPISGYKVRNFE